MRCDSLKQLASVSTDVTFAQEFISRDGHALLVEIVEEAKESVTHTHKHVRTQYMRMHARHTHHTHMHIVVHACTRHILTRTHRHWCTHGHTLFVEWCSCF